MPTEKIMTITTTPRLVLEMNLLRKEAKIQNYGLDPIYLGQRNDIRTSGTTKGLELMAGETICLNRREDPEYIKGPLYAISTGESQIYVFEA